MQAKLLPVYRWLIVIIALSLTMTGLILPAKAADETESHYVVVDTIVGKILDFDDNRILYNGGDGLYVKNRQNQTTVYVGGAASNGALAADGVFYTAGGYAYFRGRDNANVQVASSTGLLFAKSRDYVAFTTKIPQSTAYHIQLFNRKDNNLRNVSAQNGYKAKKDFATLSNDGRLMYKNEANEIIAYREGQTVKTPYVFMTDESSRGHMTDGIQVVFKQWLTDLDLNSLNRYQGGHEERLYVFNDDINDFQVNNGWLAYVSNDPAGDGIVLIAPEGNKRKIPYPSYPSTIAYLSDTGDLIIKDDYSMYYTNFEMNGRLVTLSNSSSLYDYHFEVIPFRKMADGKLYGFKGNTLYRFVPESEGPPPDIPVESVSLDKTTLELYGSNISAQLTATVLPTNASNRQVVWKSDNPDIVMVKDAASGVITSMNKGTTKIVAMAADGRVTADCTVTVTDPQGKVQFDPGSLVKAVKESDGNIYATVYRIGGSQGELSIPYTTKSDTAASYLDFTPAAGILTFRDGQTMATISISIINDKVKERMESFSLKLAAPSALVTPETGTTFYLIHDDD
ncbi:Calx-beta domain-containing protein [Paenibacillus methanolicus]|uniref:Ig-like protein group 2 n=1 Tax=Paenibacillus methanolicus TaxID=582686 RepID=A0A5S5BSW8_9BACL|nr:Calx-beta domain-containing protein [Paenibacillus methanolicus]TYP70271.1 Ig-like protein group 2 [Paenibacillus methanolicus]